MTGIAIRHETLYQYGQPVAFGLHRLLVRPQGTHATRIVSAELTVSPPGQTRWAYDALGNCVCWYAPDGLSDRLSIVSELVIERYPAPLAPFKADDPHTAAFDAQGILWFTVQGGNMVGRLDPKTTKIDLKEVPTESALPYGIQINSKGIPIFCELGTNKMGSINPQTLAITEYPLPEGARPRRLAIAADDTVYFTDFKGGHLGWLITTTRAVKMLPSPGGADSNPYGIAITPNGHVWYSESGVHPNTIIEFDPSTGNFARANIPSGGGVVRNMAATPDGRVYIACSGVNKVGVVEPSHAK